MASIKSLGANPRNPRKISKEKLEMLAKSMVEFGSLDGIIYNQRTKQLVGGHQRQVVMPEESQFVIENKFKKPTSTGTVSTGYVEFGGERYPLRVVDWDENKEKAANIAANKGAGDWDFKLLQEFVLELDQENFDLDLTMFDSAEATSLFGSFTNKTPDTSILDDDEDSEKANALKAGVVKSVILAFSTDDYESIKPKIDAIKAKGIDLSYEFKKLVEEINENS